ncbi:hypothetical protein MITS9509_02895 [Synechococcus sp. MIT S9509]|uniref:hypothetical protein n=1 Tax=Synechococcus sp. MIT S9509 TaxID=1801630 RepID=UPI0007BC4A76|nr:hypothetical protein [Synechococcus sp. MIT S9509]KZR89830.1 hypothetical protein MITS9509_02895 [Synechococcus sp. MIT S9509]
MGHQLRYALLEHLGAPDDPSGCHLDLLLEDGDSCRSWRLQAIPRLNGPAVRATPLPPHRLVWLDRKAASVSGNRGWARRVVAGKMRSGLPADANQPIQVELEGMAVIGLSEPVVLEITADQCRMRTPFDQSTANST